MRRGHPGIGGWRNENPRHFRPRSSGVPHFRPSRGYGHAENPRFPPPGPPRSYSGSAPYSLDHGAPEHHERSSYRSSHRQSNQQRSQERPPYSHNQNHRQIFPLLQRMRHGDMPDHAKNFKEQSYYDNQSSRQVNSMGDVDHRQPMHSQAKGFNNPSPWINPPYGYDNQSPSKSYRHQEVTEPNKAVPPEFTGHRPPASDHYGGHHGSTMDNSNTFSRSVDDTVDIVRKKLLNRESVPQHSSEVSPQNENESNNRKEPIASSYSNTPQQQSAKRRSHPHPRIRNVKSNCDKIKSKIVQQLVMMDKDRIHKLIDNPNSSTKFEYAISSLITESQNSFNRHLRSVAEKSLCTSSTFSSDFIHNDNNTIYEDTFMKQMQCLLDPQDTVLLEDIKPIVLAELSKVLQLDNPDTRPEIDEVFNRDDLFNSQYTNEPYEYDSYNQQYDAYSPPHHEDYFEQKPLVSDFERPERVSAPRHRNEPNIKYDDQQDFESEQLFQRRSRKKSSEDHDHRRISEDRDHRRTSEDRDRRRTSSEARHCKRKSMDGKPDGNRRSNTPAPFFDAHAEHFSEEEDPFAELDMQYHVAVDHNFIENEVGSPQPSLNSRNPSPLPSLPRKELRVQLTPERIRPVSKINVKTPEKIITHEEIKHELDNQLLDIAKSPLKFGVPSNTYKSDSVATPTKTIKVKCEHALLNSSNEMDTPEKVAQDVCDKSIDNNVYVKQEHTSSQNTETSLEKSENSGSTAKSCTPSSRKRSTDQRPSHRKEKRKKSESDSKLPETNKQILNKNIIINVNDCAGKASESCDSSKSVFNLFFSKDKSHKDSSKDVKKNDSSDRGYSEKYVKRKENSKHSRDRDKDSQNKRCDSSSGQHSNQSPPNPSSTNVSQTPIKADVVIKLKPIDMFVEQPRKPAKVHETCRNTVQKPPTMPTNTTTPKPIKQTKQRISNANTKSKTAQTQTSPVDCGKQSQVNSIPKTSKNHFSKFCQTERTKLITRGTQSEPVITKAPTKSCDAFERMKEIDMEIQALLQEKFKLYNSLESKESCPSTMQDLGMAVLNVNPENDANDAENTLSEDTIVDDFTNIPVEELEQIAFETVQHEKASRAVKKSLRQKVVEEERKRSVSPAVSTTSTRSRRNVKPPNISLLEQIITDDIPLEDLISLEDLEGGSKSQKSNKKGKKTKPKKIQKKETQTFNFQKKGKKSKEIIYTSDNEEEHPKVKDCSVRLVREDLHKLLERFRRRLDSCKENAASNTSNAPSNTSTESIGKVESEPAPETAAADTVIEEAVVNDIQIDMLDVSEDIVIGDVCEVKTDDKGADDSFTPSICEEIIVDNSQSSMEDAAGGEAENDDECKVYDFSSDESLRRDSITVSGNADAVLAIECIDNNFIAACLDGNVYYFSGDGALLTTLRGSNLAVTCLTIVRERYGTTVYTGSLDSRIRYYDLETGKEKGPECNVLSPIQTMDRAWDTVFVGTRTGFVLQFECKNNMLIPVSTVKFSDQSILALRAMKEGPRKVLLVAARSEAVTIKDAQTGLLLRTLEGPKMTVYTLLFEDGKVYCGTSSHQIHVFDYASGSHVGCHEGGKGAVCLRAAGGLLFAGCYDGCVYVFREGAARPLAQLRGPGLMLLSLAIQGTKIIAGYKDRSLYIWKIPLSILQEMIL